MKKIAILLVLFIVAAIVTHGICISIDYNDAIQLRYRTMAGIFYMCAFACITLISARVHFSLRRSKDSRIPMLKVFWTIIGIASGICSLGFATTMLVANMYGFNYFDLSFWDRFSDLPAIIMGISFFMAARKCFFMDIYSSKMQNLLMRKYQIGSLILFGPMVILTVLAMYGRRYNPSAHEFNAEIVVMAIAGLAAGALFSYMYLSATPPASLGSAEYALDRFKEKIIKHQKQVARNIRDIQTLYSNSLSGSGLLSDQNQDIKDTINELTEKMSEVRKEYAEIKACKYNTFSKYLLGEKIGSYLKVNNQMI